MTDGAVIPVPIDDQVQVVYRDSLIYVVTGWSNNINVNNVQIYDPSNDQWQEGTPIGPTQIPSFGAAGTIIGDTIYFFGGARNSSFAIQSILRKGAINPDNPLELEWSTESITTSTYRPAVTSAKNNAYILGGAGQTYNYDGLSYSSGVGVPPSNRSVVYRPEDGFKESDFSNELPMDLRGIANVSDSVKYLAGGMIAEQTVTDKIWRLELIDIPTSNEEVIIDPDILKVFPNPATSVINISLDQEINCESLKVEIFNQNGQLVKFEEPKSCEFQLKVEQLPKGIYQIKITNSERILSSRFVKGGNH